ncbi:MAG: CotH kinase family protein, partial [Atopobiaceae bacterium]|nr:CotH kinase family protein [Atopobiaceae bacterium]
MAKRTVRNGLTRMRAFCLICLAVCLSLLVVSGHAWAEETPEEAGQDATADVELVTEDVPELAGEAEDEASIESLDVDDPAEESVTADDELDTEHAEALLPETEVQPEASLIAQDSDSATQDNGIPALRLTIDPDEYQKMIDSPNHEYRAAGATISLDVPEGYTGEFSATELPDLENLSLEYIRGRGNSTWGDSKHPFKFKLDKKADLLGMGRGKHWVLLANSYDGTLLRNRLTAYLGRRLGLKYTPKMEPVDLYVNDEYIGSYVLVPQVRVDGNSVDIDELGPGDTSEPEVSGGYLLSLDPYEDEPDINTFTTSRGVEFMVSNPDFSEMEGLDEDALQAQRAYITAYLQRVEDALFADSMTDEDGVLYSYYLDLRSSAAYWWVQEFGMNSDAFVTPSTYLYKDRNGKLCWGPLWDFDIAYDDNGLTKEYYESLTMTKRMKWLDHMCVNDADYQELLRDTWRDLDAIVDDVVVEGGVLDQYAAEIKDSWLANQRLWAYDPMTDEEAERYFEEQVERLRNYLKNRRAG